MKNTNAFVLFAMSSVSSIVPVMAQTQLDPIVVTASRFEQPLTSTIAAVTVVTRDDIERQGHQSVDEILRSIPGVTLSNLGGRGQTQTLQMRGSPRSRHVLVLVDGVPLGDPTSGVASLDYLSVSNIERIEVVRGPKSSLYGSDAMGGIIQIFTRQPEQSQTEISATIGSYGYAKISVSDSFELTERLRLNGQFSFEREDGFNVQPDVGDMDRDGYQLASSSFGLSYAPDSATTANVNWQFRKGSTEFDSFANEGDVTDYSYHQIQANLKQQQATSAAVYGVYFKSGERNTYHDGIDASDGDLFIDNQLGVSAQRTFYLSESLDVVVGVETRLDDVSGSDISYYPENYLTTGRFTVGVFSGIAYHAERWRLDSSIRVHNDDQYGEAVVGSFGASVDLTQQWMASLSWGTAYSVPTFDDLYSTFGNPELKPERSATTEVGMNFVDNWGELGVSVFQTQFTDRIGGFPPTNQAEATVLGLESTVTLKPNQSTLLNVNYTLLNTEDGNGDRLIRLPEHKIVIQAERGFERVRLGVQGSAEFGRLDTDFTVFPSEAVSLDDYSRWDLFLSAQPADGLRLTARANNVFDTDYTHVLGYRTPGRNYTLSARYRF